MNPTTVATDMVVKALALWARVVMIGRAYLWGLAANGQTDAENDFGGRDCQCAHDPVLPPWALVSSRWYIVRRSERPTSRGR